MITGAQVRAARALLDWSTRHLATKAGTTVPVILQIERSNDELRVSPHVAEIQRALEEGGVEFIESVGVKLRTPK